MLLDGLRVFPNTIENEYYSRELASFHRSDLVLLCSDYEQYKLEDKFGIKNTLLSTFFYGDSQIGKLRKYGWKSRKHFFWLGNFNHPPNLDSIKYIVNDIWPKIHQKLPDAELHIYGIY